MTWHLKLLLIEDNPADVRFVKEILNEISGTIGVTVADTLKEAITTLNSESYDAILLDLGLPDSRGLETLTSLVSHGAAAPIIVMTGTSDEQVGIDAVRSGAQDYLIKGKVEAEVLRRSVLYSIERKKAEMALAEKEKFLETVIALNPIAVTVRDLATDRTVYRGGKGIGLPVLNHGEAGGATAYITSMFYPGDPDKLAASANEVRLGRDDFVGDVEVRVKDACGKWRWLRILNIVFKRDSKHLPVEMMTIVRDINELKDAERKLATRAEELESTNNDLEAFNYAVAHDLRAPMRHIEGYASLLLEELGSTLTDIPQKHLQNIREGVKRLGQLLDDLLGLSRVGQQELRKQICDLGTLVDEALRDLKPELDGREIEWRIGELPWVDCDPALIRHVLSNLLSNAVKFTAGRRPAIIEIGQTEKDREIAIYVRDNGVGFNMEYAGKLFTLFARLHRQEDFKGTGVGLAIVQRIIQRHGGRVWATAELNKGATFYFTLPADSPIDQNKRDLPISEVATAS